MNLRQIFTLSSILIALGLVGCSTDKNDSAAALDAGRGGSTAAGGHANGGETAGGGTANNDAGTADAGD